MTTIAYKDGVLAADRLVTNGSHTVATLSKVFHANLPEQHDLRVIGGMCGSVDTIAQFRQWIRTGFEKASIVNGELTRVEEFRTSLLDDEADGIVIIKSGDEIYTYLVANGPMCRVDTGCFAFGSGSAVALGAMYAGANAQAAVCIASQLDLHTGAEVDVLVFD